MPTLFRRSNGIYYVVLLNPDGRRRWISTGELTKSAAIRKLTSIDLSPSEQVRSTPLSKFIDQFLEFAPSIYSAGSVGIYSKSLDAFRQCIGNIELNRIGGKEIDRFKQLRSEIVSSVTMNIDLRTLRAAFARAVRWNLLKSNPFKQVPLCPVPEKSPTFFSSEEIDCLLSNVKEKWLRSVILFAAHTGLRREEIVNLIWSNVDLKLRVIKIESNHAYRTKAGKRRIVPMNTVVYRLIKRLHRSEHNEFVFTLNDKKIRQVWVTRRFKQYLRRLKFPESYHFHTLRHTFASWLVQRGAPIYEVQQLLGHSSLRVTEIYSHLSPCQLKATVEIIADLRGRHR